MNERRLLQELESPFIVNLKYSFQDTENLYILTEFMPGGDLRYVLQRRVKFTEEQAKFIIAWLILAIDYVHDHNVIHRDVKPENIVFESTGYIRLADFGVAREYNSNNAKETSGTFWWIITLGTPGYMAPEMLSNQNYSFSADYYAVGIILYEIIMGSRPFKGKTRKQMRDLVAKIQPQIEKVDLPANWSESSRDLTNKLLQRNPKSKYFSALFIRIEIIMKW